MNTHDFQLGQVVWYAGASSHSRVGVPCPVCFGKREVQIILGNGEIQPIECSACQQGYGAPSGMAYEWRASSWVRSGLVTGISMNGNGGLIYNVESWNQDEVFATEAEAEARRVELHAQAEKDAAAMSERTWERDKKKHAWSVSYHQSCIRDQERRIAYHYEKLRLSREKELKKKAKVAA